MTVTLDTLKKTIGKKKVNTQAFAWLADLEREAGDLDTSLQRIDGGLTLYPGDLAAHLVRTKILFEKGDYEGCIEECAKVLKMDPFCLSAQKRMGDAYDKVEKTNERNQCYRKVHDMDPLDQFWKDEYDVMAAATAAAAGVELSEADLSMSGLQTEDADSSLNFSFGDDAPFLEKSPENMAPAEEKGPKFGSGFEFVNEAPVETASDAGSTSAKSAPAAPETTAFESHGDADDPFAALSALMPDSDAGDEAAMDNLQASLDSAMESIGAEAPSAPEVFPADDDISGGDVNSAMSSFFGVDDDLEPEEPSAPASPFSNLNLSAGIDDEPAAAENANKVFSAPAAEDKPQSVDDAFGSIFGEDELPEEPAAFQKSAESSTASNAAPAADKPQSIDDAFGDIFGEDELPEEPAAFQKSADVSAADAPAGVEPAVSDAVSAAPAADKPQSIDDAFGDIFGEDELPEEPAAFQKSAEAEQPAESLDDSLSLDDTPVDAGDWSPFQKSADTSSEEKLVEETPASGDSLFEKSAEAEPAKEDSSDSVGGAIDSIFGAEDDLPEESGLFQKSADVSMAETPAEETQTVEEPAAEPAVEPSAELEIPADENKEVESSVDNAFSSIFGSDDDLPQEDLAIGGETAEPAAEEPAAEASVNSETQPAVEPAANADAFSEGASDFEKEMGGAFDSLFGSDEENTGAAVEEKNISTESLEEGLDKSFDNLFGESDDAAADSPVEEKPAEPQAEAIAPKTDFDNLESEVSGAFKGLFESDDDDLPVEKPSNKGVDFLMSGDSDDEVSAGLVKDPSATLDSVNADLEASQNTRTMAEIYLEQGICDKALEIYQDLAKKEPENKEIQDRLEQVRKIYNEKFGG